MLGGRRRCFTKFHSIESKLSWVNVIPARSGILNISPVKESFCSLNLGFLEKDNPRAKGADPKSFVDDS
jgi:hypothetical protein